MTPKVMILWGHCFIVYVHYIGQTVCLSPHLSVTGNNAL